MSHLPVRKEPVCLNCGTETTERYCYNCGQENIEPRQTVWHFISHFINDITHFDGKFFATLKFLFLKPGFLTKEYANGKRASYLDPVRMYLFTSFIFFLIFFSIFKVEEGRINGQISLGNNNSQTVSSAFIDSIRKNAIDSAFNNQVNNNNSDSNLFEQQYSGREQYDSFIAAKKINPSWIDRQLTYKQFELNKKYSKNHGKLLENISETMIHNFPKMLFLSMPFAALILQLLYIRKKQFYYVGHGIFVIHYYIFIFLMMIIGVGITKFISLFNWNFIFLRPAIFLLILFYLYKSMKNYYAQSTKLTIAKWFVFNLLFFVLFVFLFALLLFLSFMEL